ncbi:AMP-dependent synthetase/ligase [Pyrinomonas methylaliphatogenes]|uniref:AMP-forming long-chain acyl-CoA synthetase n=1 Tax=Pyrinomonas methylaliphatogenes TaxID=454194 RepID=A0A0B6X135_9BACT|nr:long-chain fatty acid--CoA ligase [Pyrinomonas methylaliphatogenes]CDM66274.1 AMP-forming long-chain acyl-CoA synthetase [Pyrinomonas methylaliphatogenes]
MKAQAEERPRTLPQLCLTALGRHNRADAVNYKQGGRWRRVSAREFARRVRSIALGLAELGVRKGDRIALLSENRPEWSIVDLAILSLGAVNVPLYTTQTPDQIRFILQDSAARVLFVSNARLLRRARQALEGIESLERISIFDAEADEDALSLAALEKRGEEMDRRDPARFDLFVGEVEPDDLATIIYTSGTTGEPKGVMLSHGNFVANVLSISSALPITAKDVAISVLPLSHIFERTVFYVFCWNGVAVHYAASFDQVGEFLAEVRPTVMTAVPRLFEKVYHRIVKRGMQGSALRRRIFSWALEVGQRYAEALDRDEKNVPASLRLEHALADRLVFSKWRAGVGGRLRYFVSGGAPLAPSLSRAFLAAGIPILQGYGMTETCIVSANRPEDNCIGSVGLPFPGVEVRIAEDGEILVRSPSVMRGYYNLPEETRAMFTADGWFRTGDVGHMDERGHLYITDRKKELFKLSNGKYVAPQLVESMIKRSALVNQVAVVGAGRKFPVALVVPDWEALAEAMAGERAVPPNSPAEWSGDPVARRILQREIARWTAELNEHERVRRAAIVPEEFSIEGGELTPTLKLRRRVIEERYAHLIDRLYNEEKDR